MNKHCRDCKHHHNAGHPPGSNLAKTYNDWCVKFSRCASKAVGECKLKGGKNCMSKVWVDPPEGWRYGFPKIWDSNEHPNMFTWLNWAGYPEGVRKEYGEHFYCRQWSVVEDQNV